VERVGEEKPITQKNTASTPRTPAVQTNATMPVMIDAEARTIAIWVSAEADSKLWYADAAVSRFFSAALARAASCSRPSPVSGSDW
jgi:hypothetical protein